MGCSGSQLPEESAVRDEFFVMNQSQLGEVTLSALQVFGGKEWKTIVWWAAPCGVHSCHNLLSERWLSQAGQVWAERTPGVSNIAKQVVIFYEFKRNI